MKVIFELSLVKLFNFSFNILNKHETKTASFLLLFAQRPIFVDFFFFEKKTKIYVLQNKKKMQTQ